MPRFTVKLASEDKIWEEEIWGPSEDYVRRLFQKRGFAVLRIKRKFSLFPRKRKISLQDKIIFVQEFIALVKSGVPFVRSFEIILQRTGNERLKEILNDVRERVIDGASLSEAFALYSEEFGMVFIASLAAGERSGRLPDTLKRYLEYIQLLADTSHTIKAALTYPAVVISVAVLLVVILVLFVIPNFAEFYKGAEISLPFLTVLLLEFSRFAQHNFLLFLILIFSAIIILKFLRSRAGFAERMDKSLLSLPFIGKATLMLNASVFLRTLSFLLSGGIPLVKASELAARTSGNSFIRRRLARIKEDVEKGENLSKSLEKTGIIPEIAIEMVRVGENAGNLEELLEQSSTFIDTEVRFKIKRWLATVEPLLIVILGIIVGIMLLSVYMPIFQLARGVR